MNHGELLAHTRGPILRDTRNPPLYSDDELTLYFNEGQEQFARRTHCLSDEESDFTFLTTEAGVALYTLDPRVITVADVRDSEFYPLRKIVRDRLPKGFGTGKPRLYTTDAAVRTIRLSPTPDAVYTLDLLVARKPLAKLVADTDVPEIDEEYHLALCDWAAYRALRNNDVDGSNMIEAEKFFLRWNEAIREGKRDVMRYRAAPTMLNNWTGKTR